VQVTENKQAVIHAMILRLIAIAVLISGTKPAILPAPYFKKIAANKSIKAFVDVITEAVVGAIAGAVVMIASRSITDIPTILIAAFTVAALL